MLIQVTVAATHPPNADQTKKLLDGLGRANYDVTGIVWVVDGSSTLHTKQRLLNDAKLKEFEDLDQWLCRVDDSMCWVRKKGGQGAAVCFPFLGTAHEDDILAEVKARVDRQATSLVNYRGGLGTPSDPLLFK
jgi:hypothetical protein